MSQVHTFPTTDELAPGFRIPYQYLGTGLDPVAKAIPDSVLLDWILVNTGAGVSPQSVSNAGTISIPAGTLIEVIAVKKAAGARSIQIGTSASGSEILEATEITPNEDFSLSVGRYFSTSATLHFTITNGPLQVLIFKKSEI